MKSSLFFFMTVVVVWGCARKPERPNILWNTAEDITTMLGTYGDSNARTPHIDAFAEQSVKYTNAYATALVCMPARSAIITGVYAVSLCTKLPRDSLNTKKSVQNPFLS